MFWELFSCIILHILRLSCEYFFMIYSIIILLYRCDKSHTYIAVFPLYRMLYIKFSEPIQYLLKTLWKQSISNKMNTLIILIDIIFQQLWLNFLILHIYTDYLQYRYIANSYLYSYYKTPTIPVNNCMFSFQQVL